MVIYSVYNDFPYVSIGPVLHLNIYIYIYTYCDFFWSYVSGYTAA